ncbi:MAG: NAD(P)/FAD-dependent oxidoreductase [Clostridium sp.]
MTIQINNISLDITEPLDLIKSKVAEKISLKESDIKELRVVKESIDARKRDNIKFTYSVEISCDNEQSLVDAMDSNDVRMSQERYTPDFAIGDKELTHRPIIVGMGPAGLFAGLLMAQKGFNPIIVERGECVEKRSESVDNFWKTGTLNTNSNVQFGEGGAGTFSDGKLTTRIKDIRCNYVLDELVNAGAEEEIKHLAKPHVGTDILKNIVKNIREEIISLGGEVRFDSKLEDIKIKDNKVKSVVVNGEEIPCEILILAVGHSARDTYEMLFSKDVFMSAKPFAIGVRVEHDQYLINENQYGKYADHPRLNAAEYKLTHTCKDLDRGVYSFCTCPGGVVVAAASEEGKLVTNGMSYSKRDKKNANSAIVVSVKPSDFEGNSPLAGMEFQRKYEELAFKLGGGNYIAPAQRIDDFLNDRASTRLGSVSPSYTPGYELRDMRKCLPDYVTKALKQGFTNFDRKIKGFAGKNTVMVGVETRTSAPLRIERNELGESISTKGLYPAGEGSGYSGGIISAAVDGVKIAESIMKEWRLK